VGRVQFLPLLVNWLSSMMYLYNFRKRVDAANALPGSATALTWILSILKKVCKFAFECQELGRC
jgi:hypothetical protein